MKHTLVALVEEPFAIHIDEPPAQPFEDTATTPDDDPSAGRRALGTKLHNIVAELALQAPRREPYVLANVADTLFACQGQLT